MYNSFYKEFFTFEMGDERKRNELIDSIAALVRSEANEDTAWDFYSMFSEALSNAFYHGNLEVRVRNSEEVGRQLENPDLARRKIMIYYLAVDGCVSLRVSDEGKGFNHEGVMRKLRAKDYGINEYKGLRMITGLADEFYFNERGTSITMVKYFNKL